MGRHLLGLGIGVAVALAAGVQAPSAAAAGRVLRQAASGNVTELRVLHAAAPDTSRLWTQYRLSGSGRIAVVTPVAPGTFVDPAPDAWFEALETATAPRVVPQPGIVSVCGGYSTVHVTGDLSHTGTLAPAAVAVLSSVEAVDAFAQSKSLPFYTADAQALAEYSPPYVGLVYELAGGESLTQAVRYTSVGSAVPVALSLARASSAAPDVTLWTIGEGRARLAGIVEHTPDAIGFTWFATQGKSDYPERRRELIAEDAGEAWVIETSGSAPLFQYAVLPDQAGAIPPVIDEYFDRSVSGSIDACMEAVLDARELGKSGARISDACPKGALAIVPTAEGAIPQCDAAAGAGEIDATSLICGGAEDLAHALSGMAINEARITRHRGALLAATSDASIELHAGSALPRILTAPAVDLEQCTGQSGGTGGGTSGGFGGSGAYSGSDGYSGSAGDGEYYDDDHVHTDVHVGCSGSSDSGDSCSGDSSSSSDDSCSGDSSSGSDDSCSGDSSSGSDDSCSGDSSSGSDGACSGDSSGSSEGCSGDAGGTDGGCSGGSSGGDCSVSSRRARRVKLSFWMIVAAALAFPMRRLSRAKR